MAVILLLAGSRVAAGTMTVGELVLVNAYLLQLTRPMDRLGQLYRSIKQAFVDLEQLLDSARRGARGRRPAGRQSPCAAGPGEVRFEGVGFAYGPERPILDGIDLVIPPGRTLAVVGPDRRRQVDHRPPAVPLLGPDRPAGSWSTARTCAT